MNETALKERLKVIAKDKAVNLNDIWKQLLLERFLARVSHSEYHDKFIFKGALLLGQYLTIGRETTDVDFLMKKIRSETKAIETAFHEITHVTISDGFHFKLENISELTQPHMEYAGYRIGVDATFGKMRDKIQIDIGVGDIVNPVENIFRPFEYKGKPIFEGEITLLTYPIVSIFSEKLETTISKGALNSRMKDYHDLLLIIREPGLLNPIELKPAISVTFNNRGTPLTLPITFDKTGTETLEKLWGNHLKGLGIARKNLNLPETIQEVLTEINAWLTANDIAL